MVTVVILVLNQPWVTTTGILKQQPTLLSLLDEMCVCGGVGGGGLLSTT